MQLKFYYWRSEWASENGNTMKRWLGTEYATSYREMLEFNKRIWNMNSEQINTRKQNVYVKCCKPFLFSLSLSIKSNNQFLFRGKMTLFVCLSWKTFQMKWSHFKTNINLFRVASERHTFTTLFPTFSQNCVHSIFSAKMWSIVWEVAISWKCTLFKSHHLIYFFLT